MRLYQINQTKEGVVGTWLEVLLYSFLVRNTDLQNTKIPGFLIGIERGQCGRRLWRGHTCGTEPLTCEIWCHIQVSRVRIELNCQIPYWGHRITCCGEKLSHVWRSEVSEMKCSVWVVKKTHREEIHSGEELGYSLHRKENDWAVFLLYFVCSLSRSQKYHDTFIKDIGLIFRRSQHCHCFGL